MARPRIEDGFVMIALDLWGAIMATTFNDYERLILAEINAPTYGSMKKRGARFDLTTLAEATNIDRRNLKRALRSLLEANVIVQYADGSYGLQKDWELWSPRESTLSGRLRGALVGWCFGLVARFGTKWKGKLPASDPGVGSNPSGGSIQPPQTTVTGVQSNPCDKRLRGLDPTPCPIEERAAEEIKNGEVEKETPIGVVDVAAADRPSVPLIRGHREAIDQARASFGAGFAAAVEAAGMDIARTLGGRFDCYAAAVRKAEQVNRRRPIGDLHAYCIQAARGILASGGPGPAPVAAGTAPAVPPSRTRPVEYTVAVIDPRQPELRYKAAMNRKGGPK
jgi:hypothetical protein